MSGAIAVGACSSFRSSPRRERGRSLAAPGGAPLRTPGGDLDDRGPPSRGPARAPRPLSDRGFQDPWLGPADDPRAPGREAAGSPYVTNRSPRDTEDHGRARGLRVRRGRGHGAFTVRAARAAARALGGGPLPAESGPPGGARAPAA